MFNPKYAKAWAAFISSSVGVGAMFAPQVREVMDAETISIAVGLLSTGTVWYFRNKE